MRKILHPLYVLYQVLFAWWVAILLIVLTSITILIFGHWFKIKNGDHIPGVIWCKLTCWLFLIPVKVVDRDKYMPRKGENVVFAANHQGMFDIFVMYGYIARRYKWIMKDSLRKVPFLGVACAATGHIFVNRTTPQKDLLRRALDTLEDSSLGVFPEGTRSRNGKLGTFKKGAFVMANMSQKTVVPVSIQGSYDILPRGCWCVHWSPVVLTFHKPIECQGRGSENVEYLMEQTRAAIAATLGEE